MQTLQDKAVVITGAASGIGRALALALGRHGARLLLADLHAAHLAAVAQELRSSGVTCHVRVTDTGRRDELQALAEAAQTLLGGADVVINNAGVALVSPIEQLDTADAHWLMDINFWGVVHGCQAFLPQLQTRPEAMLVNLSSIFAMVSMPTQSIYNASKAAVRAFSDALREELRGSPVQVLCVHPGGIRTQLVNTSRITDAGLIAHSAQDVKDRFNQIALTSPEAAAQAIVQAMLRGRSRLLIGPDAVLLDALYRLAPSRVSGWLGKLARKGKNGFTGVSPMVNTASRIALLLTYAGALVALWAPLPWDAGPWLQRISLIVLAIHVLETAVAWRLLARYRGGMAASVLLSLLFGLLHWTPLLRLPAASTPASTATTRRP